MIEATKLEKNAVTSITNMTFTKELMMKYMSLTRKSFGLAAIEKPISKNIKMVIPASFISDKDSFSILCMGFCYQSSYIIMVNIYY